MANDPRFIHLRVHTEYSLLEGAIPVKKLPGLIAGMDMPAVAVTDTNNLFGAMEFKRSALDEDNPGFYRFKVKLKAEIVSFGVPDLDVQVGGEHVTAAKWNELLADPEVVVIDTRNQYEIDIGTFPGSVSPERNSSEAPPPVETLDPPPVPRPPRCCGC